MKGTLSNSTGRGKRSQFTVQQVKEIQAVFSEEIKLNAKINVESVGKKIEKKQAP